jgi:hypothetical protein
VLTFVPLLFPDGRLPSRRWRPVAWLSAVPIALLCGPIAILYWPLRGPALVAPGDFGQPTPGALAVLDPLVGGLMLVCGLACALALLLRFRHARGVQRQQLKWFVFAAAVTLIAWWGSDQLGAHGVQLPLVNVLLVFVAPAIPAAAGVAIVRYRLYDIDKLINRTLVYGLLTALLAAVYTGVVLGLGSYSKGSAPSRPAGWSPARPWPWPPCSSRPPPDPDRGRPAPLRRGPHDRGVQRPAPPAARPGHPLGRAAGRDQPDDGADQCRAVVATFPNRLVEP